MTKIKTSFSGHDKFDCKIDWIVKGLKAVKSDNSVFSESNREKSIASLGLGINMIKSLSHWLKVLGLINENELTNFGNLILEEDPYLENNDLLWLLHWNLVKNKQGSTLYNKFFNEIYIYKFTKDDILEKVIQWLTSNNIKLSETTLKSDIDVFIKMYANSQQDDVNMSLLADLNIITKSNDNYILNINSTSNISDDVFIYILNDYLEIFKLNENDSLSISDIQRGELSIQKSLCMSENKLFSRINRLSELTNGKLSYSEASGIRQIYVKEKLDSNELLRNIFK